VQMSCVVFVYESGLCRVVVCCIIEFSLVVVCCTNESCRVVVSCVLHK